MHFYRVHPAFVVWVLSVFGSTCTCTTAVPLRASLPASYWHQGIGSATEFSRCFKHAFWGIVLSCVYLSIFIAFSSQPCLQPTPAIFSLFFLWDLKYKFWYLGVCMVRGSLDRVLPSRFHMLWLSVLLKSVTNFYVGVDSAIPLT
jgi:hypothetical protein